MISVLPRRNDEGFFLLLDRPLSRPPSQPHHPGYLFTPITTRPAAGASTPTLPPRPKPSAASAPSATASAPGPRPGSCPGCSTMLVATTSPVPRSPRCLPEQGREFTPPALECVPLRFAKGAHRPVDPMTAFGPALPDEPPPTSPPTPLINPPRYPVLLLAPAHSRDLATGSQPPFASAMLPRRRPGPLRPVQSPSPHGVRRPAPADALETRAREAE